MSLHHDTMSVLVCMECRSLQEQLVGLDSRLADSDAQVQQLQAENALLRSSNPALLNLQSSLNQANPAAEESHADQPAEASATTIQVSKLSIYSCLHIQSMASAAAMLV